MTDHDGNTAPGEAQSVLPERVQHGLCEHCGYYLEGTPIADGILRCPECGMESSLALEAPAPRGDRGIGCLLIAGIGIIGPLAVIILTAATAWRLIGGLAIGVIALAVLPRTLRRVFDV